MNSVKCTGCGLVNFATNDVCRRCGTGVFPEPRQIEAPSASDGTERGFWQWLLWAFGTTVTILAIAYASLLVTSDGLTSDERATVMDAVAVLEHANFSKEARALRHLASFRSSDHWWNRYVGHPTAYAATNFPFGVVTLYPAFFALPVDDIERATILLHESHHLFGEGEQEALQYVWIAKKQLGWTSARYRHTRVWRNTREWTVGTVPNLFTCGGGQDDCLE
jgi:hypothetical protein